MKKRSQSKRYEFILFYKFYTDTSNYTGQCYVALKKKNITSRMIDKIIELRKIDLQANIVIIQGWKFLKVKK